MKVILQKDVKHLGRKGDIVNVKDGYFLNFLFPGSLAEVATRGRLQVATVRLENRTKKVEELKSKAADVKATLEGKVFEIKSKTTGKETLYAAVGEKDVVKAIKEQAKLELDPSHVIMTEHFKKIGEHQVTVHLAEGVEAKVTVKIEAL